MAQREILEFMKENKDIGFTIKDIMDQFRCQNRQQIMKQLNKLAHEDMIKKYVTRFSLAIYSYRSEDDSDGRRATQ